MAAPAAEQGVARWEHFPHEADVGVRGFGSDMAGAFEQAAMALTAAVTDPAMVRPQERIEIACTAPDRELLLTEWLNALIYEMAVRRMLFSHFVVTIADGQLSGEAWGEPVDRGRHHPAAEPKGATFTELRVREAPTGGWLAQCVIDV